MPDPETPQLTATTHESFVLLRARHLTHMQVGTIIDNVTQVQQHAGTLGDEFDLLRDRALVLRLEVTTEDPADIFLAGVRTAELIHEIQENLTDGLVVDITTLTRAPGPLLVVVAAGAAQRFSEERAA